MNRCLALQLILCVRVCVRACTKQWLKMHHSWKESDFFSSAFMSESDSEAAPPSTSWLAPHSAGLLRHEEGVRSGGKTRQAKFNLVVLPSSKWEMFVEWCYQPPAITLPFIGFSGRKLQRQHDHVGSINKKSLMSSAWRGSLQHTETLRAPLFQKKKIKINIPWRLTIL